MNAFPFFFESLRVHLSNMYRKEKIYNIKDHISENVNQCGYLDRNKIDRLLYRILSVELNFLYSACVTLCNEQIIFAVHNTDPVDFVSYSF